MSPYLIAIVVSWFVAQGAKYVAVVLKTGNLRHVRQLYLSGNMPSAHSATVTSVATVVAMRDGMDSAVFGLAVLIAGVVMYDAMMVRRSVGEQGSSIQEIIKKGRFNVRLPRAAKGHTPLEVLVGAIVGIIVGSVVYIATR